MAARILRPCERIIARPSDRFAARRQRGAVALMFGLMLLMIIGFVGMAFDLGRAYDRRTELQLIVDTAALAGAASLDGTTAGVTAAIAHATDRVKALQYNFSNAASLSTGANSAAIAFSSTPDAPASSWKSISQAGAAPAGLLFMRVDANALRDADNTPYGRLDTLFMRAFSPELTHLTTSAQAVAGRQNAASKAVLLYR